MDCEVCNFIGIAPFLAIRALFAFWPSISHTAHLAETFLKGEKKTLPTSDLQKYPLVFSSRQLIICVYIQIYDLPHINFYEWHEVYQG